MVQAKCDVDRGYCQPIKSHSKKVTEASIRDREGSEDSKRDQTGTVLSSLLSEFRVFDIPRIQTGTEKIR